MGFKLRFFSLALLPLAAGCGDFNTKRTELPDENIFQSDAVCGDIAPGAKEINNYCFIDGKNPAVPQWPGCSKGQMSIVRIKPTPLTHQKVFQIPQKLYIRNVDNMVAIDVSTVAVEDQYRSAGYFPTFAKLILKDILVENVNRTPAGESCASNTVAGGALHTDFIHIEGWADPHSMPTELLLENVVIRNGNAVGLIINNGKFSKITFRNVQVHQSVQVEAKFAGAIAEVVVEDSPGLRVSLMGDTKGFSSVRIARSPGATVTATQGQYGTPSVCGSDGHC